MNRSPVISVIMSIYNGADIAHIAIDSILAQTFTDFEFIIVNDGSTDKTDKILERYKKQDDRIIIITQKNTGLTTALNNGINTARGHFIARLDADDIAHPDRFDIQYNLMSKHNDIVLCGANCINIYPDGLQSEWGWEDEAALAGKIYYKTPFAHSTAFIRKTALDTAGVYDENYKTSQDAELWMRLKKHGRIVMIKNPLVERRILASSISIKRRWRQFYDVLTARLYHAPMHKKLMALLYSIASLFINYMPSGVLYYLKRHKH